MRFIGPPAQTLFLPAPVSRSQLTRLKTAFCWANPRDATFLNVFVEMYLMQLCWTLFVWMYLLSQPSWCNLLECIVLNVFDEVTPVMQPLKCVGLNVFDEATLMMQPLKWFCLNVFASMYFLWQLWCCSLWNVLESMFLQFIYLNVFDETTLMMQLQPSSN